MNDAEIRSMLTVALMAALADGDKDARERDALRALVARIGEGRVDLAEVYDDVLVRRIGVGEAVRALATPELRRQAFEVAVAIADADGAHTPAEGEFLRGLASALGISENEAASHLGTADAVASAAGVASATGRDPTPAAGRPAPDVAELDRQIVNASITNAALELLPESIASMAILPLQVRLVYRIGQSYGYELDQGHIKEFVAALGVGLTGQYLEQFGRKLLGGLLGGVLGGIGGGVGRQAASSGMAFATTWALGQVAKQYYGGGRTLDAAKLKAAFAPLLEQGQGLVSRYGGEIAQRAKAIDLRSLPSLIRQV